MLNIVSVGDPKNPTLIIAHGLFGSAKNWGALCKRLSDKWYVIAVDMRNHGGSEFYPVHNYEAMAEEFENELSKLTEVTIMCSVSEDIVYEE